MRLNTMIFKKMAAAAAVALVSLTMAGPAAAALVKQSNSGICHDTGSSWYDRTKNYKSFGSMAECLATGRAYSGYSGPTRAQQVKAPSAPDRPTRAVSVAYDRDLYDHWIDVDGDCQNARHELLLKMSTGATKLSGDKCSVTRGRWNDPYSGQIFNNSRDLDIDHIVPLAWAHAHGADRWNADLRRQFANDERNLLAVKASENRSKGAKGPLEWLPSNTAYHCQYVTRFQRIVKMYKLEYTNYERKKMNALRTRLCSKG